jgi:uncharacterized protein YbaR (Trm112 family)
MRQDGLDFCAAYLRITEFRKSSPYRGIPPRRVRKLDYTSAALLQSNFDRGAFMPIPKDLLDILVCPECKTPLRPLADSASGLQCETCRRIYPIRDDIPVLIIDQATKAPD